jgi:DNA polymerase-3 subunit delta
MMFSYPMNDERALASAMGVQPFQLRDSLVAAKNFGYQGIERSILLLHHYNLRSIGIHDSGTADASLMKELLVKLISPL